MATRGSLAICGLEKGDLASNLWQAAGPLAMPRSWHRIWGLAVELARDLAGQLSHFRNHKPGG